MNSITLLSGHILESHTYFRTRSDNTVTHFWNGKASKREDGETCLHIERFTKFNDDSIMHHPMTYKTLSSLHGDIKL